MKAKELLTVIAPGSFVQIGPNPSDRLTGQVLQVNVRYNDCVSYLVVWWDGRTRKSEWMEACEVARLENTPLTTIGFSSRIKD